MCYVFAPPLLFFLASKQANQPRQTRPKESVLRFVSRFSSSLLSVNVDREKHLEDDAPDAVKEEEGDVMAEETLPLAIRIRYSMSSTDMQCAATRKSERAMISLLYCKTHQVCLHSCLQCSHMPPLML